MYRRFVIQPELKILTENESQQLTEVDCIQVEFKETNMRNCMDYKIDKYRADTVEHPTHLYVNYEGIKLYLMKRMMKIVL